MTAARLPRSALLRSTSMLALLATLQSQVSAAPEDTIREGAPGVPASASALASVSSRVTGQVSERTGGFSYKYPIAVPPGRLGMEPSLALSYSSDAPLVGGVAAGWSLALPEIGPDETRSLTSDQAWLSPQGRLVPFTEPGAVGGAPTFRAWGDASFTRYTRVAADLWEVRGTDGGVSRFRRVPGGPIDDRFVLVSSADRFGNTVSYTWRRVTSPSGFVADQLDAIDYSSNEAAGIEPHARVTFDYGSMITCGEAVTPVGARLVTTASGAMMLRDASPLTTIRTEVRDEPGAPYRTVREISLGYKDLSCGSRTTVRLLTSVQERGRSPEGVWTTMPAARFAYGDLDTRPTSERTGEDFTAGHWKLQPDAIAWGLSPVAVGLGSWDWNELHAMLIDIDGDGDQDRLFGGRYMEGNGLPNLNPHCTALAYRNVDGLHFTENAYPVLLPHQWDGKYCTLTSQPKIPPATHVPPGPPTVGNGEESPVQVSRFLDLDHDGLVDIVSAVFLRNGDEGDDDQRLHHPNCDKGVANPPWVICGGAGDSVRPWMFPPRGRFASQRRNQYYDGKYVWRWYRNTGATGFELTPRFIASPIPLDLVGTSRIPDGLAVGNEFTLVDLTGDGYLDAVWTEPDAQGWAVWIGDGNGTFIGNPDGSPLRWDTPEHADSVSSVVHEGNGVNGNGWSLDHVTTSLLDVNSDGRVDLLREDPALSQDRVLAYLNGGRGFASVPIVLLVGGRKAVERLSARTSWTRLADSSFTVCRSGASPTSTATASSIGSSTHRPARSGRVAASWVLPSGSAPNCSAAPWRLCL